MGSGFNLDLPPKADLIVPFFKTVSYPLGVWGFIVLTYCVIVGTSNAVNLTDGLDGLAIMPTVMVGAALGIFAYVTGRADFSSYLFLPHIPGAGELTVICAAIAGAGLGFLWFNAYPAEVFMGDVGALALGAALGTIAVIVRQEIVLFIMGGVFVVETLSVIMQVASFKLTGKRVFRMAPIHHHYELKGWKENQVVVRFWIITMLLVLFGCRLTEATSGGRTDGLHGPQCCCAGRRDHGVVARALPIGARRERARGRHAHGAAACRGTRFGASDVPLTTGPFTADTLAGADLIAISPGVAQGQAAIAAAIARGVEVAGDIEIFAQALPPAQKVLAITGSNGKTTVTALAGALCRAAGLTTVVAGNIGEAVLDVIAPFEAGQPWPDVFVLELSSFQLETTKSLTPVAAAVLNVTENHLDRYAGMVEYAAAKARIFGGGGVQVVNRDDPRSLAMRIDGRTVESFGATVPSAEGEWGLVEFHGATWLARGGELLVPHVDRLRWSAATTR